MSDLFIGGSMNGKERVIHEGNRFSIELPDGTIEEYRKIEIAVKGATISVWVLEGTELKAEG